MLLSTSIHLYAANHKVSRSPWGFFTQPRLSCKELQLWIGTVANKIIQLPLHNQVYRQNRQTFSRLRRTNQTKAIEIARHKECSESFPQIQLKAQLIMRCESQRCSHKISKWPIRKTSKTSFYFRVKIQQDWSSLCTATIYLPVCRTLLSTATKCPQLHV